MSGIKKLLVAAAGTVAALAVAAPAYATNGYFLIGCGAKSRAMGGAAVAFPQDSLVPFVNPAGEAFVGTRFDAGLELFNPKRSAWVPGLPGGKNPVESGATLFALPNMGAAVAVSDRLSAGFAACANGGMNTTYHQNFFALSTNTQHQTLGVNFAQMQILPTIAYKITPNQAVGITPVFAIQTFRAFGIGDFNAFNFSSDPAALSNNGNDWSYGGGLKIGWMGRFFDGRLALGASATSELFMTKFNKYAGLFADHGNFDVPPTFTVGFAVKPIDRLTVAFDWQRIFYNQIQSVHNPGPQTLTPPPPSRKLGEPDGLGFGWQSINAYKLGLHYKYNEKLTLLAGTDYSQNPVPDSQVLFNTLAPGIVQWHWTAGVIYHINPAMEVTATVVRALRHDQVAFNPATGNNIRLSLQETSVEASFGMRF